MARRDRLHGHFRWRIAPVPAGVLVGEWIILARRCLPARASSPGPRPTAQYPLLHSAFVGPPPACVRAWRAQWVRAGHRWLRAATRRLRPIAGHVAAEPARQPGPRNPPANE